MIKRLIWTIWTPMSSVLKKADKLNLSLSLSSSSSWLFKWAPSLRIGCAERHSCTVRVIHPAHWKGMEFCLNKKEIWERLVPLAFRTARTCDYAPVCSVWDQVKGSTSVLKLNLKDVSIDNVHTSHSNTLDTIMHHYYQNDSFHVNYILSQTPLCYSMGLWVWQVFGNFCNLWQAWTDGLIATDKCH